MLLLNKNEEILYVIKWKDKIHCNVKQTKYSEMYIIYYFHIK